MSLNLSSLLGGGLILRQQLITATGTWTRPAKMVGNTVWLTMIGGGGAGGQGNGGTGIGAGGFGGAYLIDAQVTLGVESSVACVVGAGGIVASTAAGPTSFGAYASCIGGNTVNGGAPGGVASSSTFTSGSGGSTPLGSGGRARDPAYGGGGGGGLVLGTAPPLPVNSGSGYGAGGNGSLSGGTGVGNGHPGAILVKWLEFI